MARLKLQNALLCEHAAQELSTKFTLCGIVGGDMNVQLFPATVRFAIYSEFIADTDGPFATELEIKISGVTILKGISKGEARAGNVVVLATPNFTHTFVAAGYIEALVSVDGEPPISLLKRKISQAQAV